MSGRFASFFCHCSWLCACWGASWFTLAAAVCQAAQCMTQYIALSLSEVTRYLLFFVAKAFKIYLYKVPAELVNSDFCFLIKPFYWPPSSKCNSTHILFSISNPHDARKPDESCASLCKPRCSQKPWILLRGGNMWFVGNVFIIFFLGFVKGVGTLFKVRPSEPMAFYGTLGLCFALVSKRSQKGIHSTWYILMGRNLGNQGTLPKSFCF